MSAIYLLQQLIQNWRLLLVAYLFSVFSFVTWQDHSRGKQLQVIDAKYLAKIATMKADADHNALAYQHKLDAQQVQITAKYEDAINAQIKRTTQLKIDADNAAAANYSLQSTLSNIKRSLPQLTKEATDNYTTTLAVVFSDCATEYKKMAGIADGHASDAKTLNDAWFDIK